MSTAGTVDWGRPKNPREKQLVLRVCVYFRYGFERGVARRFDARCRPTLGVARRSASLGARRSDTLEF